MITKLNEKPVKDAQCYKCGHPLASVRCQPGETKGHVSSDFRVLYICENEVCQRYARATVLYKTTTPVVPVKADLE